MSARTLLFAFLALAGMLRAQTAGNSPAATPTPAPDLAQNPAPTIKPLNPELPTIFIAGDSTAAQGWAAPFASYFDPAKVNVANRSRGGRSTRTFITGGEWDTIVADLKAGDIVLIQFGHNDGGTINDQPGPAARSRGSLPGLGEESQEIDNLLTKKHEVVHTFGWYMRKMIADVQAKGGKPIVLGLTVRNLWENGRIERGPGSYSGWSYEVAKAANVPFLDLTNVIADKWEALGQDKVKAFYPRDHTHFNPEAADIYAGTIVGLLKGLSPNPVGKFLSEKGTAAPVVPNLKPVSAK